MIHKYYVQEYLQADLIGYTLELVKATVITLLHFCLTKAK